MIILLTIIIFSAVVLVHELGHFLAARRSGVEVDEFGIGFPPRALGLKHRGTIYSINWLPLGGFVRLKGEDTAQAGPGSFGGAKLKQKALILMAGVAMNLLMAYAILVILAATGLPQLVDGQISLGHFHDNPGVILIADVVKASPAARAGLSTGTKIISVNGERLGSEQELIDFTKAHAGQTVALVVDQNYVTKEVEVKLNKTAGATGYLGVTPLKLSTRQFGAWAPIEALALMLQLIWRFLGALGALVAGFFIHHPGVSASDQVTGPVGIVVILSNVIHLGWAYVAVFVVSISLSLGLINALPIPALDGGRLATAIIRTKFKRLSARTESRIHQLGFVLLLGLIVVITVIDVRRFF